MFEASFFVSLQKYCLEHHKSLNRLSLSFHSLMITNFFPRLNDILRSMYFQVANSLRDAKFSFSSISFYQALTIQRNFTLELFILLW